MTGLKKGEAIGAASKGQKTRERIAASAAVLFNERGFAGTSLGDILEATGLTKGALYNHYAGKDAIALAAFDHTCDALRRKFDRTLARSDSSVEQLVSIIALLQSLYRHPGGCPIVNTAVEADDTHPALRERACQAMREWQERIAECVRQGQIKGELHPEVDGLALASLVISSLEGALVMARLFEDRSHLDFAAEHLRRHIADHVSCALL
jgi:AcrR family transcriptional regulator